MNDTEHVHCPHCYITPTVCCEHLISDLYGFISCAHCTCMLHWLGGAGGAISGTNSSSISITNTSLLNCEASQQGGAIYSDGNLTVVSATFKDNKGTMPKYACIDTFCILPN
jgi:hypothetical protein